MGGEVRKEMSRAVFGSRDVSVCRYTLLIEEYDEKEKKKST